MSLNQEGSLQHDKEDLSSLRKGMVDRYLTQRHPYLWQLSSGHYLCFLLIRRGKNIANGRFESGTGSTIYPPFSPSLGGQPGQGEKSSKHK